MGTSPKYRVVINIKVPRRVRCEVFTLMAPMPFPQFVYSLFLHLNKIFILLVKLFEIEIFRVGKDYPFIGGELLHLIQEDRKFGGV